jgi:peptidase YpeB-like protein
VDTPSTNAGTRRGLRDHPLGRVAILVLILLLAFVASKSCAGVGNRISQEEAVTIARKHIDYTPERVMVRLLKRGVQSRPFWAVSLSTVRPDGSLGRVTVVVVDARSGDVEEIRAKS